jgi:hypothetical protein
MNSSLRRTAAGLQQRQLAVGRLRRDDGSWATTVDGVELTRSAEPAAAASDV